MAKKNETKKDSFDAKLSFELLRTNIQTINRCLHDFIGNVDYEIRRYVNIWFSCLCVVCACLAFSNISASVKVAKLHDKVGILECRHWGEDSGQPWAYYDGECHLM